MLSHLESLIFSFKADLPVNIYEILQKYYFKKNVWANEVW